MCGWEDRHQRPPRLHDLLSLQKLASSRFGWSASKTLDVAQPLYDGEGRKVLTYPRAEVPYLPESAIADTAKIVAGLRAGKSYASVAVPSPSVNKELQLRLGARYGPQGWYAPPGVDLAAFRERGWL